jgi:RNA polymerase sigma-70 factor (ECF subfamily)
MSRCSEKRSSSERSELMPAESTTPRRDFEDHVGPVMGDLRRYARSLTRNPTDADDLLQDTLTRAYVKFHLWEPGTNLVAWLVVMMRRIHLSGLSSLRARAKTASIEEWNGSHGPNQDLAVELQEVARGIRKLSQNHRRMIRVVAIREIPYDEAADHFNVPVGTVRSRLGRARNHLRSVLAH